MKNLYVYTSVLGLFACADVLGTDATGADEASSQDSQKATLAGFYGALGVGGNFTDSKVTTSHQHYESVKNGGVEKIPARGADFGTIRHNDYSQHQEEGIELTCVGGDALLAARAECDAYDTSDPIVDGDAFTIPAPIDNVDMAAANGVVEYAEGANIYKGASAIKSELERRGFSNVVVDQQLPPNEYKFGVDDEGNSSEFGTVSAPFLTRVAYDDKRNYKIAGLDKGAFLGVLAAGYGRFFNSFYAGLECLVEFGQKTEKNNSFEAGFNGGSNKIHHGQVTPVISARLGYYLDSACILPYLKFGCAFVKSTASTGINHSEVRLSKAVPEIDLGIEKAMTKHSSLRAEIGYRFKSKTNGKLEFNDEMHFARHPEKDADATKTVDSKLETKGFVARIMVSLHI
ncbi:hypothetical protein FACS1894122_00320 [Alphaproteobacteria bacterium]|nr:hypothetical protein FACS1894122_00060 [Alphaproteobacteria bacterium]GHT90343.1 hypothetical protein FACS1894122_00320 [Alphaproteobacteria bacterium]